MYSELRWILLSCFHLFSSSSIRAVHSSTCCKETIYLLRQKIAPVVTENTYTGKQLVCKLSCFEGREAELLNDFHSSDLQGISSSVLQQMT